jgi:superfamily I DNA/RNA helicase
MSNFIPSAQQSAILDWTRNGTGNAIITAVAGAGKTTTLVHMMQETTDTVAFVAFNKKIADEIKNRVIRENLDPDNRITVKTFHAYGFEAFRNYQRSTKVDAKKLYLTATGKLGPDSIMVNPGCLSFAMKAVSLAKQAGIGAGIDAANRDAWYNLVNHFSLDQYLSEDSGLSLDDALRETCQLLKASNKILNVIDFDDMIYLPVRLGLKMRQYDWILPDECQDTNPMRLNMLGMMAHETTRIAAVGDDRQAIYGFTGADSDSMHNIAERFDCKPFPLTITYRCPKAVVAEAQQWVSHIHAADTAPDGIVSHCDSVSFFNNILPSLGAESVILCRNNAPIVGLAYRLLGMGKACMVEGRDIGQGLIKLASKWRKVKTVAALRSKLESWAERETAKAETKGNDTRKASIEDQLGCLTVIMAQFADDDSVTRVTDSINKMFGDTPEGSRPLVLTLSSIHKSKGKEWQRVIWWGKNIYNPSKYARQPWEQIQENNLMYVAATRAQHELCYVNLDAG